jgi:lipid A 3-O-deacylase
MQIRGRCYSRFFYSLIFAPLIVATTMAEPRIQPQTASDNPSVAPRSQNRSFHRSWQLGGFFAGGFVPNYYVHSRFIFQGQSVEDSISFDLNLFSGGLEAGKILTGYHGHNPIRGRGEAMLEIVPFWLADYPRQSQNECITGQGCTQVCCQDPDRRFGASVTPFLLRWNFMKSEASRSVPWAQLGGGLLWTNHKFPLLGGSTSVINFTPQVGAGESLFVRRGRSLDLAVKAVHISNASLGDNNPGLNVTLQFSAGYSWWK